MWGLHLPSVLAASGPVADRVPPVDLKASFTIPFRVPSSAAQGHGSGDYYESVENFRVRDFMPQGDLRVSGFRFVGVTDSNGASIPYHTDAEEPSTGKGSPDGYAVRRNESRVFHHSDIHLGLPEYVAPRTITYKQAHAPAALIVGTALKTTGYSPWAVRLRDETPLWMCMRAYNVLPQTQTFYSNWEVEYQLGETEACTNCILNGWFADGFNNYAYKEPESRFRRITFRKDVFYLGSLFHRHANVEHLEAFHSDRRLTVRGPLTPSEAPLADEDIEWLSDPPEAIQAHDSIYIRYDVSPAAGPQGAGPMAFIIFFRCADGTDSFYALGDIYESEEVSVDEWHH